MVLVDYLVMNMDEIVEMKKQIETILKRLDVLERRVTELEKICAHIGMF